MENRIGDHWLALSQAMRFVERIDSTVPTGPKSGLRFVNLLIGRQHQIGLRYAGGQCACTDQNRLRAGVILQKIFIQRDAINFFRD